MKLKVKVEGLREIEKALGQLPVATGKNILRKVARQSLEPFVASAKAAAPDDPATSGEKDLRESIRIGSRLSKRQARIHRKMFRDDRAAIEMFAGVEPDAPHGVHQEFGTDHHGPQPFMRPSWDRHAMPMLEGIKKKLWDEIEKAAKRLAKKAAKKKG